MNVFLSLRQELNRVLGVEVPNGAPLVVARAFVDILLDMPDAEAEKKRRVAIRSPHAAWEIEKCREHGYMKSLNTLLDGE